MHRPSPHVQSGHAGSSAFRSPGRSCWSRRARQVLHHIISTSPPAPTRAGATAAVGVAGGGVGAVNWRALATMFLGWIVTVPAAGLLAGLSFFMIASSPRPMPANGFFGEL
mmetsp:Transcript_8335/g.20424  ORF Transcript_8335/g.20424 Transcript_8335/m.20424 type:complete len:111 (-) Transcript_8335:48-380(-)